MANLSAPRSFGRPFVTREESQPKDILPTKSKRCSTQHDDPQDPLDLIDDNLEERFGSYHSMVKMEGFRFKHPKHRDRPKSPSVT